MLNNIILKELKNNITSLRFFLTLALTLIVIIVSTFIFVGEYNQRISDYGEIVNTNNRNLIENSKNLSSVAQTTQRLQIEPTPMELISEGGLKNLPKLFNVTAFAISEPENVLRENKFMNDFTNVDWTFITAFILSFFAILLTYDSINGEKRDGTLKLMMSNSIKRNSLIFAKYISAMVNISIPFITGIILSLLIVISFGRITFSGSQLLNILIFVCTSLFYLSIFLLLGMFISSLVKNPVTSIIVSLFIWVTFVVLIPGTGGTIAAKIFTIQSYKDFDREVRHTRSEISSRHTANYSRAMSWNGDIWAEWVPYRAAAVNDMDETRIRMMTDYMNRRINQTKKTRNVLKISPTVVFNNLSEQICKTGIERFENFNRQIRDYRLAFKEFIIEKDKLDPDSPHCVYGWESTPTSQKPVDADAILRFDEQEMSFVQMIQTALINFALLIAFNIALMILVYTAFIRYDVR